MSEWQLNSLLNLTIGMVVFGVALEGFEYVEDVYKRGCQLKNLWKTIPKIGFAILVLGLAGEWYASNAIHELDADRISALVIKNTDLQTEVIALRKNSLARSIEVSSFSRRLRNAAPANVEIRYVVSCTDCESLSFWLSEGLKQANWPVASRLPIDPPDHNWVQGVRSLHGQSAGITVLVNSPDKIVAGPKTSPGALIGALSQSLGLNFSGYDTNVQGGVDVTMPDSIIRVVIAPKA